MTEETFQAGDAVFLLVPLSDAELCIHGVVEAQAGEFVGVRLANRMLVSTHVSNVFLLDQERPQ